MKVVCTQENLVKGIQKVSRSIGKDANLPVLGNVLLEAKKGILKIAATNLELGTICMVRGRVDKEGAITIPAQLFLNYISNLPNSNIELVLAGTVLKIKCNNYTGEIKGINASEFPLIPKLDCPFFCEVPGMILKEALEKIIFAASKNEIRPEISGIFLALNKENLGIAGTDSYRLAEYVVRLKKYTKDISLIVPIATMQELLRILDEGVSSIAIHTMENQIKFDMPEAIIVSRLVEGQYPDYLKIIPKKFSTEIEIGKEDLIKAIKITSLFAKSETSELKIRVDDQKRELELSAETGSVGKNVVKLKCGITGEKVEVVFNAKYLVEGLNSISSEAVLIRMLGSSGPCMLLEKEKENHFYIVMPIKK